MVHTADIKFLYVYLHNLPALNVGVCKDSGNNADSQVLTGGLDDYVGIGAGPQRRGG